MKSGLVLPHENDSPPRIQDRCFHIPRGILAYHGNLQLAKSAHLSEVKPPIRNP